MIILLNGASCAGKSSIAQALQSLWPTPIVHLGVDHFSGILPPGYIGLDPQPGDKAHDGFRWRTATEDGQPALHLETGPFAEKWMTDMRRTLAFMAGLGHELIVDEMLLRREWVADYVQAFAALDVWLVGVRCPLAILLEREKTRGRIRGQARGTFAEAHAHCIYDIEVESGELTLVECATLILGHLTSGARPAAFDALRRELAATAGAPD